MQMYRVVPITERGDIIILINTLQYANKPTQYTDHLSTSKISNVQSQTAVNSL